MKTLTEEVSSFEKKALSTFNQFPSKEEYDYEAEQKGKK